MGLEVFDFIPDLVDTNPVGATDFVNEGDDHLRGLKFTLQNQFPNIGQDAMTLTALQLNQAAIKNEVNIFTQSQNTFFDQVNVKKSDPSSLAGHFYYDENDFARWGWFLSTTPNGNSFTMQRRDAAGVLLDLPIQVDNVTGRVTFANQTLGPDGNTAGPAWSFASAPGSGMYAASPTSVEVSAGGQVAWAMSQNGMFAGTGLGIRGDGGLDVGNPAFAFSNDFTTGMYRTNVGSIGFASSGVLALNIAPTGIFTGPFNFLGNGAALAAAPAFGFNNDQAAGMFRPFANAVGFAAAGVERLRIQTTAIVASVRHEAPDGTVALPAYTFGSQSNTGMSRPNPNELTFSAGASRQFVVKNNTCSMPLLPGSTAGLVSGDLWRNPVSPDFVAIVP